MISTKRRILCFEQLDARIVFDASYYVDSINGNDANDGLSQATAIRSIERLVSQYDSLKRDDHIRVAAGDQIVLMPGEHQFAYRFGEGQWQGLFLWNVHGTADKPITIRGMEGARVNNRAPDGTEMSSINILQSSHIIIQNVAVTSYGSAIMIADSEHIVVRDSYIHDVDGVAANNLSGVHLVGVNSILIENNLFTDNYDRDNPGNANNRHIVVFGGTDVRVLGNTMVNAEPNSGMAVDFKHLGSLTVDEVGYYQVAYNTIVNAAGTAIGTAAPNSHIHHNLLIDSGGIRAASLGGTFQLSNINIQYNTIVNNVDRLDSGGLDYFPNEYDGFPLGQLDWSHNLIVDNRQYDHSDKSTITVDRYGSDEFYRRAITGGLLHADGNIYQTRDAARFDLYAANGGPFGSLGSVLTFAQWQAMGYDRSGAVANIDIDEYFRDRSNARASAGIYAGIAPRLTALVSQWDIDETGPNSTAFLRIVRSGGDNTQSLRVNVSVSRPDEISVPTHAVIPAGTDAIELQIRGLADFELDVSQAIQIRVSSEGYPGAVTWVRLHDSPPSDLFCEPHGQAEGVFKVPNDSGETVRLQSTVAKRWAEYDNEMGIAYVDDALGRVASLRPTDEGWLQALMNRGQNATVLRSGASRGDVGQVDLVAGRYFVFYLVQNSTTDRWLAENIENSIGNGPLLFTSVPVGNPGAFDHVHETVAENRIDLAWEDLEFGGDHSFTDLVVRNEYVAADVQYEVVDDIFMEYEGEAIELDVLVNDQIPSGGRIQSVTQGEYGTVVIAESGDRLIYEPEPNRYGLVQFTYSVDVLGQVKSANVELSIAKRWTNEASASDVNGDGIVSLLDAIAIVNALTNFGEIDLPDYPDDDLASLHALDVNGDKKLSATDAIVVLLELVKNFSR